MTALLEVDVTGLVIAVLSDAFGDAARVLSETPADNPPGSFVAGLPYLRVLRIGGGDDGYALDLPTVGLHAFAADQQTATSVCAQSVAYLRAQRGVINQGAVIGRVRKIGGPSWAPADNTAVRHQVVTVQLVVKAA